jgi:glycosyltransferase involved in cell wall biosynthesis
MTTKLPPVSIVITCYNYAEYVEEAIQSVLAQTYKNIQLIIIDDGSSDNSLEIIERYKDADNVTIITRKNEGIVHTRNQGLKVATGKYLFFLDADDFFSENYIAKMVAIAEEFGADVVYPNWHVFGDQEYTKEFSDFDVQKLIRQEIHCTSESLVRLSSIGDHKFTSEKVAEDWDFFLGLALDGRKFKLAKNCHINYRVRSNTRGTAHPYWEDMYAFYDILKKWAKKYPDIVNPVDLPVYAGKIRDDHIASQNAVIKEKDDYIQGHNEQFEQKDAHIQTLQNELHDVYSSHAYKIGHAVAAPYRALKKPKKAGR